MSIKIGLSGNRYSGKSRVSKVFKQIGVPVFEADVILKFILSHNYELQYLISDKIGSSYFIDGSLNYDKVKRDGVFSRILNIVEDDLFKAWEKFQEKNNKSIYFIFKSSILFESGWNEKMDLNISVFAPYSDRIDRCKNLTRQTTATIYNLTKSEMCELDKNNLSDYVIHNYDEDSPFGDVLTQVNLIDKKIIDDYLRDNMSDKEDLNKNMIYDSNL